MKLNIGYIMPMAMGINSTKTSSLCLPAVHLKATCSMAAYILAAYLPTVRTGIIEPHARTLEMPFAGKV